VPVWLEITLGAIVAVLVLLTLGGVLANARAQARDREAREAEIEAANQALAAAHAEDRGWERSTLEAAARAAYDGANPGTPATELTLVQVIDRPGTDEDKAVFRVVSATGESRLVLGRQAGEWRAE
jgi:type II secretory pathway pseudopilin PulG